MQNDNFEEWVDCHAGFGRVSATYFIMEQLNIIISNQDKYKSPTDAEYFVALTSLAANDLKADLATILNPTK